MKNIFEKNDNKGVWLGVLLTAGAIAAGAITYLYFNNAAKGEEQNNPQEEDHSMDYLVVPKKKKHKTDLHELHVVAAN